MMVKGPFGGTEVLVFGLATGRLSAWRDGYQIEVVTSFP